MISLATFLVCGLFIVITILFFKRNGNKNLPPGPMALPLIGNILQLGAFPHLKIKEWVKTYGKIFQVQMGPNRVVIISDPKIIREAFNDSALSGRMDHAGFLLFSDGPYGITVTEGEEWMEQRRFTMRTLRDLGFGKKRMEGILMDEVNDFMMFLKSNEGQPTSPESRLSICILNCIWSVLSSGNRIKHDDKKFRDLFERQKTGIEKFTKSFLLFAPEFGKKFPNLTTWNSLAQVRDETFEIFRSHIQQHKETFQDGSEPRDFIDAYLQEIKNTINPQSSFYKERGDKNLTAIMSNFFVAGPDTTSATLSWMILYLSKFPQVQRKVQAELDKIVGKHGHATLEDRPNLPYVCATIDEILRLSSIIPLGVFHRAVSDTKFHGFDIPKGTWICHNQYYLQRSEEFWDSPNQFQPERHLSSDETTAKPRHESNTPFGVGRRACVGESLARDVIYLFLVNIFHKYDVQLSTESQNVTLDPKPSFTLSPQDYNVIMTERV